MAKLSFFAATTSVAAMTMGLWAGVSAPAAHAQDSASDGEIVVTATRREQALQDVPLAVSAYTAQDIAAQNITTTSDLQKIAPSLVISTSNSETGGSTLRIRGVGTTGNNAGLEGAVGVFIDGVYRQRAGLALNNLFDIQRVEVLRGPQGTLFGKNTSAGALTVAVATPRMNELGGAAEMTAGNYGDLEAEG
jgi:outer membrane receptor protein involved in Fe transport